MEWGNTNVYEILSGGPLLIFAFLIVWFWFWTWQFVSSYFCVRREGGIEGWSWLLRMF